MMPPRTVRIFISSPGDVVEERDQARRVIEGLQRQYPGVTLQPVLWEELTLPATTTFQDGIEHVLNRQPIDIAVFVLWSRLGTPLGPTITRPDGSSYRSGTEREFDLMLAAFEQSGRKQPLILAYTRNDDAGFRERLTTAPDTKLEELVAQRRLAEQFICEQFRDKEGRNVRAYYSYREPIGFAERLRSSFAAGPRRFAGSRCVAPLDGRTIPGSGSVRRAACGHLSRPRRGNMRSSPAAP